MTDSQPIINEIKMKEAGTSMRKFKQTYEEFRQVYQMLNPQEQLLIGNIILGVNCPWDRNANVTAFVGSPVICEALMGGIIELLRNQPQRNPRPLITPSTTGGLPN